jgi:hypothetical protein
MINPGFPLHLILRNLDRHSSLARCLAHPFQSREGGRKNAMPEWGSIVLPNKTMIRAIAVKIGVWTMWILVMYLVVFFVG